MKMHKFEIHVLDFEDRGPEQYEEMLKYVRHIVGQNFHVGTTDIGNWSDDHELNKTKNPEVWNKYYDRGKDKDAT